MMFSVGLIAGIIAMVAAGCLAAYAISLTIKWLRDKIKDKLKQKNVKKVAVADLQEMIDSCENIISLGDLNELADDGYTHMMADVGYDDQIVGDIELIKDTNDSIDEDIEELLNRTNQGMIIVER